MTNYIAFSGTRKLIVLNGPYTELAEISFFIKVNVKLTL
jgi:hypothetical protein